MKEINKLCDFFRWRVFLTFTDNKKFQELNNHDNYNVHSKIPLHDNLAFLFVILLDNTCLEDYATGCDLRSILWLKMAPSDTNNFNNQKARIEFFLILWCILCPKEITFLFLAHKLWRLHVEFECVN